MYSPFLRSRACTAKGGRVSRWQGQWTVVQQWISPARGGSLLRINERAIECAISHLAKRAFLAIQWLIPPPPSRVSVLALGA